MPKFVGHFTFKHFLLYHFDEQIWHQKKMYQGYNILYSRQTTKTLDKLKLIKAIINDIT